MIELIIPSGPNTCIIITPQLWENYMDEDRSERTRDEMIEQCRQYYLNDHIESVEALESSLESVLEGIPLPFGLWLSRETLDGLTRDWSFIGRRATPFGNYMMARRA